MSLRHPVLLSSRTSHGSFFLSVERFPSFDLSHFSTDFPCFLFVTQEKTKKKRFVALLDAEVYQMCNKRADENKEKWGGFG